MSVRVTQGDPWRLAGLGLLLVPLFARAISLVGMLPGWDLDPTVTAMPWIGVGPAESITLDMVSLVGAAVLMLRAPAARGGWVLGLVVAGACGVLLHMLAGGLGDRRIGLAWLAAVVGAYALWACRRDEAVMRVGAAVLVGFVGVLAAKAVQQMLIEHPATIAAYRADPDRFLAAQGLTPGAPMARTFERRLLQPEATGWFGLANVFATFMAGTMVAALGLLGTAMMRRPRAGAGVVIGVLTAVVAAALGVYAAGAKGGVLAACVGLGVLAVGGAAVRMRWPERARGMLGAAMGVAAVAGPVLMVVARGVVGERIGELSLLFRWFYMQGAGRIFAANPLGVGPDGFQQAYLLAKPPISPEEVASPHSILFDWAATLGVFGLAWCVLLMLGAAAIGRVVMKSEQPTEDAAGVSPARPEIRAAMMIAGIATLLAAWMERAGVTPDGAVVRLVGLGAWCGIAYGVLMVMRLTPAWKLGVAAGTLAIIAHTQIDVAGSWPQAAGLVGAWVAIAASTCGRKADQSDTPARGTRVSWQAVVLVLLVVVAMVAAKPVRAWRWQLGLLAAAESLNDVASFNMRLAALSQPGSGEDPSRIAADVVAAIKDRSQPAPPIPTNGDELRAAMAQLEAIALAGAAERIVEAAELEPSQWAARREASRMLLRAAAAARGHGDSATATTLERRAVEVVRLDPADPSVHPGTPTSSEWRWLAIAHLRVAESAPDEDVRRRSLAGAAAAFERASALDPYNPEIVLRLMRVHGQLGDAPAAQRWARKVLELDPLMRLDAGMRGLTLEERSEVERVLQSP